MGEGVARRERKHWRGRGKTEQQNQSWQVTVIVQCVSYSVSQWPLKLLRVGLLFDCLQGCLQSQSKMQRAANFLPGTLPLFSSLWVFPGQIWCEGASWSAWFSALTGCCKHQVIIAANVDTWERPCVCFVDAGLEALGCQDEVYLFVNLPVMDTPGCHSRQLGGVESVGNGELVALFKLQESPSSVVCLSNAIFSYCPCPVLVYVRAYFVLKSPWTTSTFFLEVFDMMLSNSF